MKPNSSARKETGREPWWKFPPKSGQKDEDLEWGYLITYGNGDIEFSTAETPTIDEIKNRPGSKTAGFGL